MNYLLLFTPALAMTMKLVFKNPINLLIHLPADVGWYRDSTTMKMQG